mgnify:CR=1 FL=1
MWLTDASNIANDSGSFKKFIIAITVEGVTKVVITVIRPLLFSQPAS